MSLLSLVFLAVLSFSSHVNAQNATVAYTPVSGSCPKDFNLTRQVSTTASSQTLNSDEQAYIQARAKDVLPGAWAQYLKNLEATNVTFPSYVNSILSSNASNSSTPTFGIAASGGGYRAALFGAGVFNSLDARNDSAVALGTGGLLQAASYIAGLSGGSWLITSSLQANFPTMEDLIFGDGDDADYAGWLTEVDILSAGQNATAVEDWILQLFIEIKGKYAAGFPVSIVDIWARGLSRHFLNGTTYDNMFEAGTLTHGAGITFSSLRNVSVIQSHSIPFPLVIADMQTANENQSTIPTSWFVPLTNTIFEMSVYEFGSYDPSLAAFTPMEYLGTTNTSTCITNFDQAAFLIGASSDTFDEYNTSSSALAASAIGPVIALINSSLPQAGGHAELDTAQIPNPFQGINPHTFLATNQTQLSLLDGGSDGEVIPIQPLLVKARGVDVILAIDASNNGNGFSDGAALITSANRSTFYPSTYAFPPVPANQTVFTTANLSTRPTFFGCDLPSSAPADTPLVIYLANGGPAAGHPAVTNTSTSLLNYTDAQAQAIFDQSFVIAVQGIAPNDTAGARDPLWGACLACAVVDRARNRSGVAREGVCADCFGRYCWNSTEAAYIGGGTGPGGSEAGTGGSKKNGAVGAKGAVGVLGSVLVAALGALLM